LRSRLDDLAGQDARDVDQALAAVLNRPGAQPESILAVLARNPAVHAAAARAVERWSTDDDAEVLRNIGTPPGRGDPDYRPRRYACPRGDYVWYRRVVSLLPPSCPTHGAPVEPADRG
jgi:hypothetical protein